MPVVISRYNALTGLTVGFAGFVLGNPAMMLAGIVETVQKMAAELISGVKTLG